MSVSEFSHVGNICCGNKFYFTATINVSVSRTQSLLPKHMLATIEAMLTSLCACMTLRSSNIVSGYFIYSRSFCFQVFSDNGCHRQILNLQVLCSNLEKGCEWTGPLSEIEVSLVTHVLLLRVLLLIQRIQ